MSNLNSKRTHSPLISTIGGAEHKFRIWYLTIEDGTKKTGVFFSEMEKEDLLRSLRQICKIVHGSSELMPTISTGPFQSSLSKNLKSLNPKQLTFKDGSQIRQSVLECMHRVQKHLLSTTPGQKFSVKTFVKMYLHTFWQIMTCFTC